MDSQERADDAIARRAWGEAYHHLSTADGWSAEWVVQMHVPPAKWPSRATCTECDAQTLRFAHRSVSDDGNPSYALWEWQVEPALSGARVTVRWAAQPKTFWRQALFAKIRRRQLTNEVEASLHALSYHLASARTG